MGESIKKVAKFLFGRHPVQYIGTGFFLTCTGFAYVYPEKVHSLCLFLSSNKTINNRTLVKEEQTNTMCQKIDQISNLRNAEGEHELQQGNQVRNDDLKEMAHLKTNLRIILLGASGSGKSFAGNLLLKKCAFQTSPFAKSHTKTSESASITTDWYHVDIIDTPAYPSTEENDEQDIEEQIKTAVRLSSPGPHAFLLCIPSTSITAFNIDCFRHFQKYFKDSVNDFVIVAFTRYDQFELSCSSESEKKAKFDVKLSRAMTRVDSNLKTFMNMTNEQIILGNESKDALTQVIGIIEGRKKEEKNTGENVYAVCKSLEENEH